MRTHGIFMAGEWIDSSDRMEIRSPYDGRVVAEVGRGGWEELDAAADAAVRIAPQLAQMAAADRARILSRATHLIAERRDDLAAAISEEAGKPIALAAVEASRCVDTFTEATTIARRPEVEALDLSGYGSGAGRLALIRRVPIGPVCAITPFNFPLNLVAHKLAPAIAAGCPVVLKPASQTPGPALMLAAILGEAGLPKGALSVVPAGGIDAERLATDARMAKVTFTGSMEVGWHLKEVAWRRHVTLELGGNAAVVVEPDAGELEQVARRIANAAYGYAGQSCIAVQRVLVHEDAYVALRRALEAAVAEVPFGDPSDADVVCGPLIDGDNADRVERWIGEAVGGGGRVLAGGERQRSVIRPTLVEEAPPTSSLVADEVFGPVAVLDPYEDFSQALNMVNDSRYGLQAGVFTRDTSKIQEAWAVLEVGGIVHNDVPTWRSDPMPYGGVKGSGVGREGPAWAYREMTEERTLVLMR